MARGSQGYSSATNQAGRGQSGSPGNSKRLATARSFRYRASAPSPTSPLKYSEPHMRQIARLLSPDYLQAEFTQPERAAVSGEDRTVDASYSVRPHAD